MNLKRISTAPLLAGATALLLACSATNPNTDGESGTGASSSPDGTGAGTDSSGSSGGDESELDLGGLTPMDGVPGSGVGDSDGEGCAEASALSEVLPATLLVALDRSSSMVPSTGTNRWEVATEALTAFFGDPSSTGLSASLQMFPSPTSEQSQKETFCPASVYETPDVPLTLLPNAAPFAEVIEGARPRGLTPTHGVLTSLIQQGDAVLTADPSNKVAIVLVNDGEPKGCDGEVNSLETINDLVAAAADRIPTYVIGIGDELGALHGFAAAGGTEAAIIIDPADPTAARLEILAELNFIRRKVGCDAAIPAPPSGQTLDPFKVSTQMQDAAGNTTPVSYEANCETGAGWHYDDLNSPSLISLCPQACESLKASESSLKVVFGCDVNPEIVLR